MVIGLTIVVIFMMLGLCRYGFPETEAVVKKDNNKSQGEKNA